MPAPQPLTPKYVIDTNVVLDFWGSIPGHTRNYDVDVKAFRTLWDFIAAKIVSGEILLPTMVAKELSFTVKEELQEWLKENESIFVAHDDCLSELTEIINNFENYTKSKSQLTDAIVIAVAKKKNIIVITSERKKTTVSIKNPYIPNVCESVGVKSLKIAEFLIEEKQ